MEAMLYILKWMQQYRSPVLDSFFEGVTLLGEDNFLMVVLPMIYWCVDKGLGYRLAFAYLTSATANNGLKNLFSIPRPFELDPEITPMRVHTATGYSFPSGHTQCTATFWTAIYMAYRTRILLIVSALLMVLVAISRMYLGVHTLIDVLAGLIIGIGWFFISRSIWDSISSKQQYIWHAVSLVCIVISLFFIRDILYYKVIGVLAGLFAGYIVESRWVDFEVKAIWWKQGLKYATGLTGLVLFKSILGIILPQWPASDFIRYFLLGCWMTIFAPVLFILARCSESKKGIGSGYFASSSRGRSTGFPDNQ